MGNACLFLNHDEVLCRPENVPEIPEHSASFSTRNKLLGFIADGRNLLVTFQMHAVRLALPCMGSVNMLQQVCDTEVRCPVQFAMSYRLCGM